MRKMTGRNFVSMIIFALLVSIGIVNHGSAAITEGDYCWTFKITADESGPVTPVGYVVKFHIAPLGDGTTYSMAGKVFVNGDASPFISGIASSSQAANIFANLTATQAHTSNTWRDTGTIRIILNPTTLKGTFFEVGHDFDRTSRSFDNTRYSEGTLTPRACP